MKFLPNWKEVLKKAWSVRLIILAGLLSAVEVGLAFFQINQPWFVVLTMVVTFSALIARLIAQSDIND